MLQKYIGPGLEISKSKHSHRTNLTVKPMAIITKQTLLLIGKKTRVTLVPDVSAWKVTLQSSKHGFSTALIFLTLESPPSKCKTETTGSTHGHYGRMHGIGQMKSKRRFIPPSPSF
jgi:hypothetical protein